ncbi:MAG: lytic murein transglycosylase [Proteobacteria bacterium]|nr:lytic murein transglycosylase [Pseudomonadota bacterium]MBU1964542.1 lytic murein transglycosylase [Pseudomonadota bacterium]
MTHRLSAAITVIVSQGARIFFPLVFAIIFLFFLFGTVQSAAADWKPLVERLTADGFNRQTLEALFDRPEVRFEPDAMAEKIQAILRSRAESPDDVARLKTTVRQGYLSNRVIARAHSYILDNRAVLEEVHTLYGVPKEIVVSILLIETHLGRNTGNRRVFNRLASMALCTDLETVRPHISGSLLTPENEEFARRRCREKGDWAYNEFRALLRLADLDGLDPLEIRGSIYGAIGLCQFMPSNVFSYGVDADQDGRINLFAMTDALHSIANYLRGHGWRPGMDRDGEHQVIFGYNHCTVYANTVLAVAEKLKDRNRPRP